VRAAEFVVEHQKVWRRSRSGRLKMAWRCGAGPRKGRVVADPRQCGVQLDIGKSAALKRTRARTKVRQARKAKRTKRINPISKLVRALNR
jgi:hypothetical protein